MVDYKEHIRTIENFPDPGVNFYDISTLIANGPVFKRAIHDMADPLRGKVNKVVGLDARGFVFGAGMALELGVGLVMLRKKGKLPGDTISKEYVLEYGQPQTLELQADALNSDDVVAMVDDVIATGGTAGAGADLIQSTGARIEELTSLVDLRFLKGSEVLREEGLSVRSLVEYDS